jgi:hypothetical protein
MDHLTWNSFRVFEWGSGGSTIYFSRKAATLVTVEHDEGWYRRVSIALAPQVKKGLMLELILPQPATGSDVMYTSSEGVYSGYSFENYCRFIDTYPDDYFDLIFIDGRAREGCFRHALPKIKPGGSVVLDNAERERYSHFAEVAEGFIRRDFWGPGPYSSSVINWQTSVWTKAINGVGHGALS